jgi:ABC-type uncharacterized transport system substrate-binding protein
MRSFLQFIALVLFLVIGVPQAFAHPHVWVDVESIVHYNEAGFATGIAHHWTFDETYTVYTVQGLGKNPDGSFKTEDLKALAETNTTHLKEWEYFTVVHGNGVKAPLFQAPQQAKLEYKNNRLVLSFFLPLEKPIAAQKSLGLEIYDPTYFVAFRIRDGEDAVRLDQAPKGCITQITRPKPLDATAQMRLSDALYETLTDADNFSENFSNRALVACP